MLETDKHGADKVQIMMKRGRPWHQYKDKIIKVVQEFNLSRAFHWTPEQIRNMDEADKLAYLLLLRGNNEAS